MAAGHVASALISENLLAHMFVVEPNPKVKPSVWSVAKSTRSLLLTAPVFPKVSERVCVFVSVLIIIPENCKASLNMHGLRQKWKFTYNLLTISAVAEHIADLAVGDTPWTIKSCTIDLEYRNMPHLTK